MTDKITLFDIPSATEKKAWSFNTWKTRFVLNFKQIPYTTTWLEFPDIKDSLASIGMPKIGRSGTFQGVPAISDPIHPRSSAPDSPPTLVADSWIIAQYLETNYPGETALFPHGTMALQKVLSDQLHDRLSFFDAMWDLMMYQTWARLNPASQPYFREAREEPPITLEEKCPEGPNRTMLIESLRVTLDQLDMTFAQTRGQESRGIFTIPTQIVYGDFVLASLLMWMKVLAYDEVWVHVEKWNGGRWGRFLQALDERYGQVD